MKTLAQISLALAVNACANTTSHYSTSVILPSLVNVGLSSGDEIVDCTAPENSMLGADFSYSCVSVKASDAKERQVKFGDYILRLENDRWENHGDAYSEDDPLEPSYKYLYLTKDFPNLGGKRELFILPKRQADRRSS